MHTPWYAGSDCPSCSLRLSDTPTHMSAIVGLASSSAQLAGLELVLHLLPAATGVPNRLCRVVVATDLPGERFMGKITPTHIVARELKLGRHGSSRNYGHKSIMYDARIQDAREYPF